MSPILRLGDSVGLSGVKRYFKIYLAVSRLVLSFQGASTSADLGTIRV